ncbi:hypothetical protein T10_588 [Trichinella papuae]|uniref:Uncharacterized protein n=1 Tax=Trichinella papuae TaxID=268474 RepID=A0A0V1LWP9_9BILA|nr:hypothetical protein T10_588 [Trichinella papuae]
MMFAEDSSPRDQRMLKLDPFVYGDRGSEYHSNQCHIFPVSRQCTLQL